MAAPSTYVKNNTMGSLTLVSGGTSLVVPYERGDFQITGLGSRLNEIVKIERRGKFVSHAFGARRYPTVSFSAWLPNVVGGTNVAPGTLAEFLAGLGGYAALVPTLGAGRPQTCDLSWTIEGTSFGDSSDEVVTLNDFYAMYDIAESVEGNTITVSGEVLGPVVIVNGTNTVTYQEIS